MSQISNNYYYEGTDHLNYFDTSEEVADYYSKLNQKQI